jgi:hypothetical protein
MKVNASRGDRMDAVDLCRALELAVDVWERTVIIEESRVVRKDPETMGSEVVSRESEALIDHFEFADELRDELRDSKHGHLGVVTTQLAGCVSVKCGEFSAIIKVESVSPELTLYHDGDRITGAQDLYATLKRAAELDAYLDDLGYGEPRIQSQLDSRTDGDDPSGANP